MTLKLVDNNIAAVTGGKYISLIDQGRKLQGRLVELGAADMGVPA